MGSKLKPFLWVLTLLVVGYVSQQYRVTQQIRASTQTRHATLSPSPPSLFKVAQIGSQVMRINETTGETHYWSNEGGGWVKIDETNLVSAVSETERNARKAIIRTWYNTTESELRKKVSYEIWESAWLQSPSWQIQDSFDKWKREQAEEKQRAEQERKETLIQSWHKQLTSQEQVATPYEQFEATLLTATDLAARQKVIRSWYDLMDDTYKREVPFERFEAVEVQQSLANLQSALAEQQKASPASKSRAGDTIFCPVGGERYSIDIKVCPKHGVETRPVYQSNRTGN